MELSNSVPSLRCVIVVGWEAGSGLGGGVRKRVSETDSPFLRLDGEERPVRVDNGGRMCSPTYSLLISFMVLITGCVFDDLCTGGL